MKKKTGFDYYEYRREWEAQHPDKVLKSRIRTYKRFLDKIKAERPDLYAEAMKTL